MHFFVRSFYALSCYLFIISFSDDLSFAVFLILHVMMAKLSHIINPVTDGGVETKITKKTQKMLNIEIPPATCYKKTAIHVRSAE